LLQFARYGGDQAAFGRKGITGRLHLIRRELSVRKIQLVEGDPEEILARSEEARIAGQITSSPALDPVFSGNFYEAIGEKVVKR
jgi:hypothetical protein